MVDGRAHAVDERKQHMEVPRKRVEELSEEEDAKHFHEYELKNAVLPGGQRAEVADAAVMALVHGAVEELALMHEPVHTHGPQAVYHVVDDGSPEQCCDAHAVLAPVGVG